MISATAWNNGAHHRSGAGYGLSVSAADRDRFFRRIWRTVRLRIDNGEPFAVNIDTSGAGVNLHTIGYILLAVGIIGILLSMAFWSSWGGAGFRRRSTTVGPGGTTTSSTTIEQ